MEHPTPWPRSNVLGMICGWLSNWLAGTPRTLRYHVVAAAGFGNLNSLPLLIATAICNQDSLPFQQGEPWRARDACPTAPHPLCRSAPALFALTGQKAVNDSLLYFLLVSPAVLKEQCSSVGYGYVAVGTAATQMFTCEPRRRCRPLRRPLCNVCAINGVAACHALRIHHVFTLLACRPTGHLAAEEAARASARA